MGKTGLHKFKYLILIIKDHQILPGIYLVQITLKIADFADI